MPGRLQAFPWSSWEQEFRQAPACGFDAIEWLFTADGYQQNPIWTEAGLERIRQQATTTGIQWVFWARGRSPDNPGCDSVGYLLCGAPYHPGPGNDQAASVEPHGFARLVRDIRVTEQALGDGVKRVYASELPILQRLGRENT